MKTIGKKLFQSFDFAQDKFAVWLIPRSLLRRVVSRACSGVHTFDYMQETISRMDISVWLATVGYFLILALIRFGWIVDVRFISFLIGTVVALPVLSAFELLIHLRRSLYHTLHFQILLFLLTIFALSSTVQPFGKGVVLSLLFSSLIAQGKEFLKTGSMVSWIGKGETILTNKQQQIYFLVAISVYTLLTVYFA